MCDTSSLPLALESAICHSLIESHKTRLAQLKMILYTFDQQYLDGYNDTVNVGWAPSRECTQTVVAEGQKIAEKQIQPA